MAKVLNFGSLNLDYVYSVDHFVRAGETISCTGLDTFCGGKGLNQSIALARAGAEVYHAGAVGRDGGALVRVLADNNVDTSLIYTLNLHTGHAIIQRESNGQNCILIYGGANQNISDAHIDSALSCFSGGDYLVLQNEINSIGSLMTKAKKRGLRIVLNPSPMDEKIQKLPLDLVDIFVLNEVEAESLCGSNEPQQVLNNFRELYPQAAIVLTWGKRGVWYQDASLLSPLHNGIYDVPVVDTTAAGDTFTGYFISCICEGRTIPRALEIASIASSLAVSREGAEPSIPTISEVLTSNLSPVV